MHRDPTSFQAASSFRPERWLVEATSDPESPFFNDRRDAVKPFLFGSRTCPGQHIAWAELRMALAKLLFSFDISLPEDREKWVEWESVKSYVVLDKEPIMVNFRLHD
jgi:cytochrome P450